MAAGSNTTLPRSDFCPERMRDPDPDPAGTKVNLGSGGTVLIESVTISWANDEYTFSRSSAFLPWEKRRGKGWMLGDEKGKDPILFQTK